MDEIISGELKAIVNNTYKILVNDQEYFLPIQAYSNFGITIDKEIEGILVYNKVKKKEFFEPIHPKYKIGEHYEFDIIGVDMIKDKSYFVVKDVFDNRISVNSFEWQNNDDLKKKKVKCQVIGLRFGRPILRNIEYTHPIYKIGNEYDFEFIGFGKRFKKDGSAFVIIKLKGEDGCSHEIIPLPSQYGHKFNPKKLRCKVIDITSYLSLIQVKYKDYYFSKIEEISLKKDQIKFFHGLRDKIDTDSNIKELFKQYDSESSFWIITYCNKILPDIIVNNAYNFNFEFAINFIDALLVFEEWILKSGLLDSLKRDETKQNIKLKSEGAIAKYSTMRMVFNCIINNKLEISDDFSENIRTLEYYLRFNKPELIDKKSFVKSLISTIVGIPKIPMDYFEEISHFISILDYFKSSIKNDNVELDFIIGKKNLFPFENEDRLYLFLQVTFIQIFLLKKIELNKKHNLYASEYCKYYLFTTINEFEKNNYLKYSFYFNNYASGYISLEDDDILKLNDISFISNLIIPEDLHYNKKITDSDWSAIVNSFNNKEIINVKLIRKERYGFNFIYRGVYLFATIIVL